MKINSNQSKKTILLLIGVMTLTFVVLGARFFQLAILQASHGHNLIEVSNNNQLDFQLIETKRGTIYDRSGTPLAIDSVSYTIYAVLQKGYAEKIDDPDHTAKVLSQHLNISRDEILERLLVQDLVQVEFGEAGNQLSEEQKLAIEAEQLPGIYFYSENQRKYTNDYFASHLLGYTRKEDVNSQVNNDIVIHQGVAGVEAALNDLLSGRDQLTHKSQTDSKKIIGKEVYLTLDSRLQNYLENILETVYRKYQPEEISTYLVEVKTGRLLSAGQRPSFNLNTLEGIEDRWEGQLVAETFEPGSTIKILAQGMAHQLGVYNVGERVQTGSVKIEDVEVKDYNLYGWGEITFEEALARSSNVSIVELVRRIGLEKWVGLLKDFGFGQSTNSGLPNETEGFADFDNDVSKTMSGFGQGFAATPMQLLQAFTTIGNDGKMMKVQYVESVNNSTYHPIVIKQMMDEKTTDYILRLMVDTVNQTFGTAQDFKMSNVNIAAKTGTAQIANQEGTGYLTGPNDYYFSVISFFPAEDPEYMLYLTMKRPLKNQGRMGTQILAEVFKPFVEYILIQE